MKLNRAIFWDVDFDQLDLSKYSHWIIVRVIERGNVDDIRQIRRYYGEQLVKEALLVANAIRLNRLHLALSHH